MPSGGIKAGDRVVNRLENSLNRLLERNGKAFIAYVVAGEPDWDTAADIILAMEDAGVSAVELGVPFSDPIADGPVIQAATNRALQRGVTLPEIYRRVELLRKCTQIPILLMGYWNVFLQFGRERSLTAAREAGVDGLIIADLPPEAEPGFFDRARELDLSAVLLACELTSQERMRVIAGTGSGFIYYVPQLGITGLELRLDARLGPRIRNIREVSGLPVCIGIGVKTRDDVKSLTAEADGVIVGTRLVDHIAGYAGQRGLPQSVADLVTSLLP